MLLPKRVKYRRQQRGRMTGKALRGNTVTHGEFALQALPPARIRSVRGVALSSSIRTFCTRYCPSGILRVTLHDAHPMHTAAISTTLPTPARITISY